MTIQAERAGEFFGVPGRFENVHLWPFDGKIPERAHGKFSTQKFKSEWRQYVEGGQHYLIRFEASFDDDCKNGHNDFAITGEIWESTHDKRRKGSDMVAGGCIHDEIAKHFPEVAHVIKWHLTGEAGPMHYAANAVYLAGDRDHNRKRKGEPYAWDECVTFGANPIRHKLGGKFAKFLQANAAATNASGPRFDFEVIAYHHDNKPGGYQFSPKYTFGGFAERWHECPFDSEGEALRFLEALQTCDPVFGQVPTLFSEGKARELDAARSVAIWPDATDAQLSVEPDELRAALEARLPGLLVEFRAMIDASGFSWTA